MQDFKVIFDYFGNPITLILISSLNKKSIILLKRVKKINFIHLETFSRVVKNNFNNLFFGF
jgi:hypothetical protein